MVIILCFFFPFFLIKCGNTTLMSVRGTDLVTGISKKAMDERVKENIRKNAPYASSPNQEDTDEHDSPDRVNGNDSGKGDISPNPFIIVAFLAALAGITVQAVRRIGNKALWNMALSAAGLTGFVFFYLGFRSKMEAMENNQLAEGLGSKISIIYSFGTAFYIAALVFLVILLSCSMEIFMKKRSGHPEGPARPPVD